MQIRHNSIRSFLAEKLRQKELSVLEEVNGLEEHGSIRRIDIIVINRSKNQAFILDPSIRLVKNPPRSQEVHEEIVAIYAPTVNYYKNQYAVDTIEVRILIGARGTIPGRFIQLLEKIGLEKAVAKEIALIAVRTSIQIIRNHLFHTESNH